MASVPALVLPQSKLDKLADDLKKLEVNPVVNMGGSTAVPTFQRQGYLEKRGSTRDKWFKRFFVLRDSFVLGYNLQKSDYTVEPRAAIHLGNATIQVMPEHEGRAFCFVITTMQKDKFVFSAESEQERIAWLEDLEVARKVTHANMVKLAVENRCLAEQKGAVGVALDNSTSALAIFSNPEYVQNTPITGGAEGWLRTRGFNPEEQATKSLLGSTKLPSVQKLYFILRDSHLMMFQGGDMLTKPRGVMFLLGTVIEYNPANDAEGEYSFKVRSYQCGDEIELTCSSSRVRQRWMDALRVAARVTYPDFRLLLKEHEILASLTLTPRAAPPSKPNAPSDQVLPPVPLLHEDFDLQGEQLDPGTEQAYDASGAPLLRNPDGKLVSSANEEVFQPITPRFNAAGQQLDPFNRPLPPGAVPMFTAEGKPIGVGPDGQHYLPDGTVVAQEEPHYDAAGQTLDSKTVEAANAIAPTINVALQVRTMLKGESDREEAVDVLGRTFRGMNDTKSVDTGKLINADGEEVPLVSARRVQNQSGQLVQYEIPKPAPAPQSSGLRVITTDDQGDDKLLAEVEIDARTTLRDVRNMIQSDLQAHFVDFIFLLHGVPLLKYEETSKFASICYPEVTVRGNELKAVKVPPVTKKVAEIAQYEEKKKQEQDEFNDVLAKVRQGRFLRSTKASYLEP